METSIEVKDAVKKVLDGPGERLGYRAIHQKLWMEHDIKAPRELVYTLKQEEDDESLNRRKQIIKKARKR